MYAQLSVSITQACSDRPLINGQDDCEQYIVVVQQMALLGPIKGPTKDLTTTIR